MSRQAGKDAAAAAAAAAARDLLKADAARARKAGATRAGVVAPQRKVSGRSDLVAPPRNGPGRGRMPPVQEVSSSWSPTGPRSFADGSFFNSSPDDFFGSPGQSPQSWNPQSSDPSTWGANPTPPGGFQNFIFGGDASQFGPFRPPRSMHDVQSEEEQTTPISAKDNSVEDAPRTEKRIFWTQEEDVRMMSAWLLNSSDPSCGADRKNDQYWSDVEATYNETTPKHRARNAKQIKDRFHKVNKWTDLFHSAWLKARMIYSSGYNDQMWIEKAHVLYIEDNKKLNLGPFVLMEVWNTVKTEAKWITYNSGLKAARNRKGSTNDKLGETDDIVDVDELAEQPRPMGQKQAKKLKYAKSKEVDHIDLDGELEKFSKLQDDANANRLKVLEVQQKLSSEKMEQTKLAHLAAKEQKEARKLELESRMFETYNNLLSKDVSLMTAEEKLDHANTMKCLKRRLFADN